MVNKGHANLKLHKLHRNGGPLPLGGESPDLEAVVVVVGGEVGGGQRGRPGGEEVEVDDVMAGLGGTGGGTGFKKKTWNCQ